MAHHIKDEILPKLQEIQRDIFFDENIYMNVSLDTYKLCVTAHVYVHPGTDMADIICTKLFSFTTYYNDVSEQGACNAKELRGVAHFIKNWQKRLG